MTKPVLKIVLVSGSVLLIVLAMSGLLRIQGQRQQYLLNRQLIDALERGHAGEALRLVRAGADPNTRVEVFEAPSLRQRIQQFLHSRASAPLPVNVSPTALQVACGVRLESTPSGSDKEIVALLDDPQLIPAMLEHGADVNAPTNAWSALEATVMKDRPHLTALLLEHGADIKDWRSLESVVPSPRLVEILVQHGVDVNASLHGRSHFIMAVEAGTDPALVEMLLKHGADVNARDDKGITVLMKANERLVPLLLRHGAALNRQDARGNMALHHAVWSATDRNYTDSAVKLLLQRHANFRLKNRYGETPRGMLPKRKKFKGRYAFRDYPEDVMEILEKAGVRE